MAALTAYAAGLTTSGMEILSQALLGVFGEVSIKELGKDELKYGVRMSMKSPSIVFVVLDSSSEDLCKEIENGLYMSDKYYRYTDDRSLTQFLNSRFGLSLEVPEDIEELETVSNSNADQRIDSDLSEMKERYESQLADKDGLIKSLNCTIRGLEKILDEGGYAPNSDEVDSLKEENTSLRSSISDLQSRLDSFESKNVSSATEIADLTTKLEFVNKQLSSIRGEYDSVNRELTDTKVESSKKSGVIRDKVAEIDRLTKQIEGLTAFVSQHQECDSTISSLNREVEALKAESKTKNEQISRLQMELASEGKTQEQLEEYKTLLAKKQEEASLLSRRLSESDGALTSAKHTLDSVSSEYNSVKEEYAEIQQKLEKADSYISELNSKNIELLGKLRVLEQSTSRDASLEDALADLAKLKRDYAELQGNVFNALYLKALPKSSSRAMLFNTVGLNYENIRFVFSGSTESRKGTYKSLLNEFSRDMHGDKYLLVDVVSETYVDYVFKINKVVNGLKWFTDGGGVQQYITQTCLPNVRVLSPGLGYINDSFFLSIKWEKRLKELNSSGYKVILYCGDLSNLIGRVLFENFADIGRSEIYVHGNSVGSRTMVGVSRGISNIRKATVKYFEYDPQVAKFVDHIKQKCACEIISSISR